MTSPLKPWEQSGLNSSSPIEYSFAPSGGRPVLPPRPVVKPAVRPYRPTYPVSSGFYSGSGYGYGGLGSYGAMGGFGAYSPFGNYGSYGYRGTYDDTLESRWIQRMEDSARPTFDSIESVVRVFGSMASMLDSTFFAVTNTFRAILAVTENFGRLRTMFSRIWVSVGLFRSINWLFRVLREKLGLLPKSDSARDAWQEAVNATLNEVTPRSSGWPALLFLGALIAAPYILTKLNSEPIGNYSENDKTNFIAKNDQESLERGIKAKVLYEFKGTNPEELSVRPGDMVIIAPTSVQDRLGLTDSGWVQAACNGTTGIIPFSYIQPSIKPNTIKSVCKPNISNVLPVSNLQSTSKAEISTLAQTSKDQVVLTETPKLAPALDIDIYPQISEGNQS